MREVHAESFPGQPYVVLEQIYKLILFGYCFAPRREDVPGGLKEAD